MLRPNIKFVFITNPNKTSLMDTQDYSIGIFYIKILPSFCLIFHQENNHRASLSHINQTMTIYLVLN
jgi:hypothetical protein